MSLWARLERLERLERHSHPGRSFWEWLAGACTEDELDEEGRQLVRQFKSTPAGLGTPDPIEARIAAAETTACDGRGAPPSLSNRPATPRQGGPG
jgi:hypothetical protein